MSEDVRQKGIVVEANGKKATVRFKKTDACGHCNACFRFGSNEADIEWTILSAQRRATRCI